MTTKLEELKATCDAARSDAKTAYAVALTADADWADVEAWDTADAADDALVAYCDELKKINGEL
jgi:hypothetical protein